MKSLSSPQHVFEEEKMAGQKILTSGNMAALESDPFPDLPPPRQGTELRDSRTSGSTGEHRARKPPKITAKSVRGKPLEIDMQPIDAVRLLSAFGTAESDSPA
jgi:hypothetical protein